ncbi:MAG: hypothetical protein AB7P04_06320 [Bacteriovoracia bacterium]
MNQPTADYLQGIWKQLAGPSAALQARGLQSGMSPGLLGELARARDKYAIVSIGWDPPAFFTPEREVEWCEGRRALLEALSRSEAVAGPLPLRGSLTHAEKTTIAVSARASGVGVDLESRHRPIHPSLGEKIQSPTEAGFALRALELWVLKEACFKAHPRREHADSDARVLSGYRLQAVDPPGSDAGGLAGVAEGYGEVFRFRLIRTADWLVSFALAGNNP